MKPVLETARPIAIPWRQRLDHLRRGSLALVVWLAAAGLAAVMLAERGRQFEYIGLAHVLYHHVTAPEMGRVGELRVGLFDQVDAGQVIALMDDAPIAAEIETARLAAGRLRSELAAMGERLATDHLALSSDWSNRLRSHYLNEARWRIQAIELGVTLESDRIEHQRIELEMSRLEQLAGSHAVSTADHEDAVLRLAGLARRIQENEVLLERIGEAHLEAAERRAAFESGRPDNPGMDLLLEPFREAVRVQEARLEEINLRRRGLVLRAQTRGVVTAVLAGRGQAVVAGEPLLELTDLAASKLVAYVSEREAGRVEPGQLVLMTRDTEPATVHETFVASLGPAIDELPRRLWRMPDMPEYGRPVVLAYMPAMGELLPGERIRVRLEGIR